MPGISIHVVDTTRGVPAAGMCIEIFALAPERRLIAKGALAQSGALEHPVCRERLSPGAYEVLFHAGDFFAAAGVTQTSPPFLDVVVSLPDYRSRPALSLADEDHSVGFLDIPRELITSLRRVV